nr:zf-HC2 domain-containing protein [Armatimonadota bacterium]
EQSTPVCDFIRPLLVSFADGELAAADRDRVAGHVDECADCDGHLVQVRRTARLVASLPTVEPPAWLRARVLAQTTQRPLRRPELAGVGAVLLAVAGVVLFFLPQADHKAPRVALLPPAVRQGVVRTDVQPQANGVASQSSEPNPFTDSATPGVDAAPKEKPSANVPLDKNVPIKASAASIPAGYAGSSQPAAAGTDMSLAPPLRERVPMIDDSVNATQPSIPLENIAPPAPEPMETGAPSPARRVPAVRRTVNHTSVPRPAPDRNVQPDSATLTGESSMPAPNSVADATDAGSNFASENTAHTVVFHRLVAHDRLVENPDLLQQRYPVTAQSNRGESDYMRERKDMALRDNGFGRALNGRWVIKASTHRMIKW